MAGTKSEAQPPPSAGEKLSIIELRDDGIVFLGPEVTMPAPSALGKPWELTILLRENGNPAVHHPLDAVEGHGLPQEIIDEFAEYGGRFVFCRV